MANAFDQFDQAPSGNAFDQFDAAGSSQNEAPPSFGWGHSLASAVTDIPSEIGKQYSGAWQGVKEGLNPFDPEREKANAAGLPGEWENFKRTGSGLANAAYLASGFGPAVTGAARSLLGHPLAQAEHSIGSVIAPDIAAKDNPQAMYETAANDAQDTISALGPRGGLRRVPAAVPPPPAAGPLGVTLSAGQASGDLSLIQREQAALRGQSGDMALQRAKEFAAQQRQQVETAQDRIARSLDPMNYNVASDPQEAGQMVSQSMQSAARNAKAGVNQAYTQARAMPGEIHADVFDGIGSAIKSDLSGRPEPVIIDDQLTPYASRAIQDVDSRISQISIQNRASPTGQPPRSSIVGVNLDGVDQMRKRLSAFRQQAFASGNAADGRAAQAVLGAFDQRIDDAVNGGFFSGNQQAVQAWNDARAAHADYRSTFGAQKGDPVGRVVEKILGKGNAPAAIPNDVADFIYGSSGVNPNTLNVGVANRVKQIMGEQSPEWSAVKQGLFSRVVEPPAGMTDWGPGKISQRINRFLNGDGRELAQAVFDPHERAMLQSYADLQRQLEVPQAGANWSNTATFSARALQRIGGRLGVVVGAALGRMILPAAPWGVAEGIGAGIARAGDAGAQAIQARQVAQQMPIVTQQMQQWQRAVQKAQAQNAGPSRGTALVAGAGMARALRPLGIDASQIIGSVPAGAQENQDNQRQRGGRRNDEPNRDGQAKRQFAAGGKVNAGKINGGKVQARFHPQSIGARKAKDGQWYIRDKARPGKYLRVVGRG